MEVGRPWLPLARGRHDPRGRRGHGRGHGHGHRRRVAGLVGLKSSPAFISILLVLACAGGPPSDLDDLCSIFEQKKNWYKDAKASFERWGVPAAIQLAIVYQESRFRADARPSRKKILGIIPGSRPSSAYGYGQVLDGTWERYEKSTGRSGADRDDFGDVADFIGWYGNVVQRRSGLDKSDARGLYLAYHEGPSGFARGSHHSKPGLLKTANRVAARAARYQAQYDGCREDLDRGFFFGLF